jgi:hypothetical protein
MKTLKFLIDIKQQNKVLTAPVKKEFQNFSFNFAIIKATFPASEKKGIPTNCTKLELIHVESGARLPMYKHSNKTINDFYLKSVQTIGQIIDSIGMQEFENTLNSQPKIN